MTTDEDAAITAAALRLARDALAAAALRERLAYENGRLDGWRAGFRYGQEDGYVAATAGEAAPDIQRDIKARDAWLARMTRREPTRYTTRPATAQEIQAQARASWGLSDDDTDGTQHTPPAAGAQCPGRTTRHAPREHAATIRRPPLDEDTDDDTDGTR